MVPAWFLNIIYVNTINNLQFRVQARVQQNHALSATKNFTLATYEG